MPEQEPPAAPPDLQPQVVKTSALLTLRARLAGIGKFGRIAAAAVAAVMIAAGLALHRGRKPARPAPAPAPSRAPAAPAPRFPALAALRQSCRARLAKYAETFSKVDPKFSGVRSYGKALQELDPAKPWNVQALTVKNPDYWRAIMEMVPQDPSVAFSNAYLCALDGQLNRAEAWLLFGGLGMEERWKPDRDGLKQALDAARVQLDAEIKKGSALHDAGKYKEAVALYDSILADAPREAWALYEKSFSLLAADAKASAVTREELYAAIRELDPFYWQAYQGADRDVISRRLPLLLSEVMPFVQGKSRDAKALAKFAVGGEKIGIHDFAAQAFWKLLLIEKEKTDQNMAHFLFNLKRLGLDAFVASAAGPSILKSVAALEKKNPLPTAHPAPDPQAEAALQAAREAAAEKRRRAAQEAEARDRAIDSSCSSEIGVLCHDFSNDLGKAKKCLHEHQDVLLEACRRALQGKSR